MKNVLWFKELGIKDVPQVGGKNASLGEMYNNLLSKGVNLANGFATTSQAYFIFLEKSGLSLQIQNILKDINVHDLAALQEKGKKVRQLILSVNLQPALQEEIIAAYRQLSDMYGSKNTDVAVRS